MSRKNWWILLVLFIILIAFFVRLFPLRTAHWWDETVYLQNAETLFSHRLNYDEFSFRPPLLSILFYAGFFLWHSPIFASILTAALSVLGPVFIFLIGKKIYGVNVGAIAGILSSFAPFIVVNSNYLLTDVPAFSLMAISFYFLLFKDKNSLFLAGVFFSFAILMKFTSVLLGVVFLFFLLIKKYNFKSLILFFLGSLIIILPYLIWAQVSFGNLLSPFITGMGMVDDFNESTMFYLQNLHNIFTIITLAGLLLWVILIIFRLRKKKYGVWREDLTLLLWAGVFLAYLTYTPHKELRYLFPLTVPVMLLAAQGLSFIFSLVYKKSKIFLYLGLFIVLLAVIYPVFSYLLSNQFILIDNSKTDEMRMSEYLIGEVNYSGIIYSNHNWPVFAYYTGLKTEILWPRDNYFYGYFPIIMNQTGILIVEEGVNKHPTVEWLDSNSKFSFVKRIGNILAYKFVP